LGTFYRLLATSLVAAGHRVRVVGIYPAAWEGSEREEIEGVEVWRLREPALPAGWLLGRFRLFRQISAWSRKREIDLVEVPDWQGLAAGWPSLRVPVIVRLNSSSTYLSAELGRSGSRITRWLEQQSLRRADFWCSSSRYLAERTRTLFGLSAEADAILFNPIDASTLPPGNARSGSDVVFTGTLSVSKGIVVLVRAWPRVRAEFPSARLHVFGRDGGVPGGGSMQAHLEALLGQGLRDSVEFHGLAPRSEVMGWLERARVAVFPSFAEGFAMAPLESMSRGCPTVYTSRCSGPEVIEDGRDGILVDPDDVDAVATAIIRVLTDDALAQALGRGGRARVEKDFSIKTMIQKNEQFLAGCLAGFRSRSLSTGLASEKSTLS
jgi:glycosyltransferase involved in cell wall biosynthesis